MMLGDGDHVQMVGTFRGNDGVHVFSLHVVSDAPFIDVDGGGDLEGHEDYFLVLTPLAISIYSHPSFNTSLSL
jgi:hypothetical protein